MKKSLLAGLDLPDLNKKPAEPANIPAEATAGLFIPLENIEPDPDQPRKMSADVDEDLKLLAESILQHGVLQPIVVSSIGQGRYRIVSGERRWRAAQLALRSGKPCVRKGYDLKRLPVFIRNPEDAADKLEMQMVENLARADMSDVDIGTALNRLLKNTGVSKAEMARRLGRSATWIGTVLAKASPEALEVAERIGVSPEDLGAGETMRMISWSRDAEKQVVLDAIAAEIKNGRAYSRALLDEAEERYEIHRRFPKLANRTDLSLDDLRTWKGFWDSPDAGQRAIADRVLNGMGLVEAMQTAAVMPPKVVEPVSTDEIGDSDETTWKDSDMDESHWNPATSEPPVSIPVAEHMAAGLIADEFDIDEAESADAALARVALAPSTESPSPEERRSIDAAGMAMESGRGPVPVADAQDVDVVVRIPGDAVRRILEKAGVADDLTVDADTVLGAILRLI